MRRGPQLSRADRLYRRQRMSKILDAFAAPTAPVSLFAWAERRARRRQRASVAELADKWVVSEVRSDGEPGFIAHPLWDDEWLMTRDSHATREQAVAEVSRCGGELLDD